MMKEFFVGVGVSVTFCILFVLAMDHFVKQDVHIEMTYDCRLAEISPDYPQIVKQKCRELLQPKVRSA